MYNKCIKNEIVLCSFFIVLLGTNYLSLYKLWNIKYIISVNFVYDLNASIFSVKADIVQHNEEWQNSFSYNLNVYIFKSRILLISK